jgi:hypothetical protein
MRQSKRVLTIIEAQERLLKRLDILYPLLFVMISSALIAIIIIGFL